MASIYTQLFRDIFEESSKFLIHDFIELKGQIDNQKNRDDFCIHSYTKVFDVLMQHLYKIKYNGDVVLPYQINLTRNNAIQTTDIIEKSASMKKIISVPKKNKEGKIEYAKEKMIEIVDDKTINNPIVKLSNAREEKDVKSRIVIIPIDGFVSFSRSVNDFAVVLAYQQQDNKDTTFITQQVMVYLPFSRDIFSFDKMEGFTCNKNKIADRNIMPTTQIESIFVDNYSKQFSFNLNKLIQISNVYLSSTSIFQSLCMLSSTTINLLVYHKNDDVLVQNLIEFCIKTASFDMLQLGEHILIGSTKMLEKFRQK